MKLEGGNLKLPKPAQSKAVMPEKDRMVGNKPDSQRGKGGGPRQQLGGPSESKFGKMGPKLSRK